MHAKKSQFQCMFCILITCMYHMQKQLFFVLWHIQDDVSFFSLYPCQNLKVASLSHLGV